MRPLTTEHRPQSERSERSVLCLLSSVLCLLLVSHSEPLGAVDRPATAYKEITWEQLLPRDATTISQKLDSNEDLAAYLEKRGKGGANPALRGEHVKIHGFVVPLERDRDEALTEFLLVPYFGACIHVPPPPQNQIIDVTPSQPVKGIQAMDTVWVYGKMEIENVSSSAGEAAYKISAATLERETAFPLSQAALAIGLTLLCGMSVCLGWVGPLAVIRLDTRWASMAAAFAAGSMVGLGFSTALLGLSVKIALAFLLGAAGMLPFGTLSHGKERRVAAVAEAKPAGAGTALAVALHSFPECFVVLSTLMATPALGLALGGSMLAHNVPLGISLGLSSGREARGRHAWRHAALAGVAPPLAAMLVYFGLRSLFSTDVVQILLACAGGALVFIALAELMPLALRHGGKVSVSAGFTSGIILLLLILMTSYRGR
jgi:zinc transporter ZupT